MRGKRDFRPQDIPGLRELDGMTVRHYPDQRSRAAQVDRHAINNLLAANRLNATLQMYFEPQVAPSFHYGTLVTDCTISGYSYKINLDNIVLLTKDMSPGYQRGRLSSAMSEKSTGCAPRPACTDHPEMELSAISFGEHLLDIT